MNWKRGITRLYLVAWAAWLLAFGGKTAVLIAANAHHGELGMALGVFAWLGLVLPGGFLIALRWALDGFTHPHDNR
ncbi:hypothetical protein QLQ15_14405 [Lysobacter sp. LF1]|uniref:DUF997 family protein n=1 Tax=Lysobacter stagni TaxID=3045172 RepID=A0ABT6XIW3_9GAMM|nr:hypothetical protein [Lysobacter sp. LF1]MDI9240103.1 hypothetical protein [Lysobacter sp. LF1]